MQETEAQRHARLIATASQSRDKRNVHHQQNLKSALIGFTELCKIHGHMTSVDFFREVMDLVSYLNSETCLNGVTNKTQIISDACLVLGIEDKTEKNQGFPDFFEDAGMYSEQFETTGAELLARTWHFVKNYRDKDTGEPEIGLKDIMIQSLAQGINAKKRLCFTGKVNAICSGVWAGRVFEEPEPLVDPDTTLKFLTAKYCQKLSTDIDPKLLGVDALEDIRAGLKNGFFKMQHIETFKSNLRTFLEHSGDDDLVTKAPAFFEAFSTYKIK